MVRALVALALALLGLARWAQADAGLVVDATRVIVKSPMREASIRVSNAADRPTLIQSWIDAGDPSAAPDSIAAPVVVLPPLVRLAANENRALRLVLAEDIAPTSTEQVYWLNLQEVPLLTPVDESTIAVAVRIRLKVFVRGNDDALTFDAALKQLDCRGEREARRVRISCYNPSGIHLTVASLALTTPTGTSGETDGTMLEPKGGAQFELDDPGQAASGAELQLIDDSGQLVHRQVALAGG